jgi:hypothetical protein
MIDPFVHQVPVQKSAVPPKVQSGQAARPSPRLCRPPDDRRGEEAPRRLGPRFGEKNGPADRPSAREIFCLHEHILVASRSYKVTRAARPRIKATEPRAATYEHPAID